jgi:hypothetical protein
MNLDPEVWGGKYWFFLRTIAIIYPKYPSTITKKKYYDLIHNFSLFIPNEDISKKFDKLLNLYPLSPYLNDRESLCRWIWFINNKINETLEKPKIPINRFYTDYYDLYKQNKVSLKEKYKLYEKILYVILIIVCLALSFYLYKK